MPAAMSPTPLPHLVLYGKPGCHLCEEARVTIEALLRDRRRTGLAVPVLIERDITNDPAWERAYFETIPVLEVAGRQLALATSPRRIARLLEETLDGQTARPGV